MEIIDHEPYTWFLLRQDGEYYLDARCSRSAAEFTMLVRLTPQERANFQTMGHTFIDGLARDIDNNSERYMDRDYDRELGKLVTETVVAWRRATEETPPG